MSLSAAPLSTHPNGMNVATGLPQQFNGHQQNITGGLHNHAVQKTLESTKEQALHAKESGAGMRGGSKKTKKRRRRIKGGSAAHIPSVPEGGTIPGVSFGGNHMNLLNTLNQSKANQTYDGQINAQPYKVGGSRRKTRRKTKKNVRRRRRNISKHIMGNRR